MDLHDTQGQRLYLTAEERAAFLAAAKNAPLPVRTFSLVLHYTGCRISETLKKRRRGIYRAVPVPEEVLDTLNMVHGLQKDRKRRRRVKARAPLWPWSRTTAWRRVKEVLEAAAIADGPHKSPKGLRHGYGVAADSSGVPPNMLKKWMGHASLAVTALYSDALGEEQHQIAERMWE